MKQFLSALALIGFLALSVTDAFTTVAPSSLLLGSHHRVEAKDLISSPLFMSTEQESGVVELADDDDTTEVAVASDGGEEKVVAPFLSQGEISEEEVDLSDPKQARVMFYIILSLLPVLFLIPLMLGSRDLVPMDMLPPVEIN